LFEGLKKINKMGIYGLSFYKGKAVPKYRKYPEYIKGTWAQYTILNDRINSKAIECLYLNDDREEGTIVMSNFINNDYPVAWGTIIIEGWKEDHYTAVIDRFYTSPPHRRKRFTYCLGLIGYPIWVTYYKILPRPGKMNTNATTNMILDGFALLESASKKRKSKNKESAIKFDNWKEPEANIEHENVPYKDPILPALWHSMSIWEPDDKKFK
jgi:hypothetical protein